MDHKHDQVDLLVAGKAIRNFLSYRVEADLYNAADSFDIELSTPNSEITCGQPCQLRVNGIVELAGVIDRVTQSYNKDGGSLRIEGRDLMGLLVDSHVKDAVTIDGWGIKRLAEFLIGKNVKTGRPAIPFISTKQIHYQEQFIGKTRKVRKSSNDPVSIILEKPDTISLITPGQTVFQVLNDYAKSVGFLFWMDYTDGGPRLVFGRPVAGGGTSYSLTSKKDGQGNNVLDGCYTEDMSRRYSEVTAIGQYNSTAQKHVIALKKDGTFPFFKPFVTHLRNGSQTPMLYARLVIEKMRHEGVQLVYRVPGHSQDGKNWRINELCDVNDERFTLHSPYLIFGRTFERSMSGTTTVLRLGPMGMIV